MSVLPLHKIDTLRQRRMASEPLFFVDPPLTTWTVEIEFGDRQARFNGGGTRSVRNCVRKMVRNVRAVRVNDRAWLTSRGCSGSEQTFNTTKTYLDVPVKS
jgi:hypothetical protein